MFWVPIITYRDAFTMSRTLDALPMKEEASSVIK